MPRRRRRWRPLPDRAQPSPRAYVQLVDAYTASLAEHVRATLRAVYAKRRRTDAASADEWSDDEISAEELYEATRLLSVELALREDPEPPQVQTLTRQTRSIQIKVTAGQRLQLLRAGAPPQLLIQRLGLQGPELLGIALRLSMGEQALVQHWAHEGVSLIRTAGQQLLRGLPRDIEDSLAAGASWRTLAEHVEQRLGVTERHARFIARDQTAQLNGRITEHLQKKAGVTHYIWRSSHDQRVRPSHDDADGKTYAWASAGAPGVSFYGAAAHPGQAGNCRCTAEPVIPREW